MSCGVNQGDLYIHVTVYVDKILRVINLQTAKALNRTIPKSVLYQGGQGDQGCAEINRHGIADERAAQESASAIRDILVDLASEAVKKIMLP